MPLPSRETQESLRDIKSQVDALKPLQVEIGVELDDLLSGVLDRAFKGEL